MTLKPSSCEVLVQPGRIAAVPGELLAASGFNVTDVGIKILGNPVGTEGYRRTELRRKIEAMWRPLPALAHIHPQSAFILLKECVDARPCYLERVAEPELMWEALEEFDSRMARRSPPSPGQPWIPTCPSFAPFHRTWGGSASLATPDSGVPHSARRAARRSPTTSKRTPPEMISLMGWRHGDPSRPVTIETMLTERTAPPTGGEDPAPLGNHGTGIFGGTGGGRQW